MFTGNKENDAILIDSNIGFEFEFFHKDGIDTAKRELSKILSKKIEIQEKAHSEFIPSDTTFKLEPDFSGGQKTIELVTGPMKYIEAILILKKTLKYIQSNGSTNDRCGLHFNVSFNSTKHGNTFLSHMNILKFILDYDEEYVYQNFPNRRDNVYANSIKHILPSTKYYLENSIDLTETPSNKILLPSTKYYGINFSKLVKNYLEFRYIGGKKYEDNIDSIQNIINMSIVTLYKSIVNKEFTADNKDELDKIFKKHERLIKSYKSYDDFKRMYPKIKLTINLNDNYKIISSYYHNIKDNIFNILLESNIKQGELNYDSDRGRLQIKGANLSNCHFIKHCDIIACRITGNVKDCTITNSDIMNSSLDTCNIYSNTDINKSKLKNCYVSLGIKLKNSYIFGVNTIFNGRMDGGIFREGNVTDDANLANCEVINFKKI